MPARLLPCLALLVTGACATGRAAAGASAGAAVSDGDRRQVVAAVERLFESMRTRDTAALRALLLPGLVMAVAVEDGAGWTMETQTVDRFIASVARPPAEIRERMWNPEVRVDGGLATVWAPYDLHVGTRFSHCGTDAVQLVRGERGWVITGLSFTVRPARCAPPG